MDNEFEVHLKIAKSFFDEGLPYWCEDFNRPKDQEFNEYINSKGYISNYSILNIFEQVYIPKNCDYCQVVSTANERKVLREQGVNKEDLPILI